MNDLCNNTNSFLLCLMPLVNSSSKNLDLGDVPPYKSILRTQELNATKYFLMITFYIYLNVNSSY